MLEFTSIDRSTVAGHDIRIVLAPFGMSRDNPEITGQVAMVDGEEMTIVGVERTLPMSRIRKGEMIGLSVRQRRAAHD